MDECVLYDLIECSVCLERLDGSSKVLPCQHTFCKPCLEEIVLSRKELRCPECRVLVETKVDDLPCNILLIRILDGMKNAPRNITSTGTLTATTTTNTTSTAAVANHRRIEDGELTPSKVDLQQKSLQSNQWRQPYARALYAYDARESGDLQFKKGDVIVLRKKVDHNWFQGELGDKQGYVPASYVQVISGQPPAPHVPQCRALYDFKMNDCNEKDCLGFAKGEIVTVIRRIDENWAEGKLKERIGIFPISFVEMNSPARSLMKLSTNLNPGPSRVAPPTPSSDSDTTPLITASSTQSARGPPHAVAACTSSSASTSLSSSPSSSSSSSTSSSNSLTTTSTSPSSANSSASTPSLGSPPRVRTRPPNADMAASVPPPAAVSQPWPPQSREKRHSLTALPAPQTAPGAVPPGNPTAVQHRRSLEILDGHGGAVTEAGSGGSGAIRGSHSPWTARVDGSPTVVGQQTLSLFVALYPYKPQKEDELELRKGELYTVIERCQDGWYKGASLRSGRSGVFPGNYVQVAKSSLLQVHFRQAGSSSVANIRPTVVSRTGSLPHPPSHSHHRSRSVRNSGVDNAVNGERGHGSAGLGRVRSAASVVSERTQGFLDWARSVTALAASPSLSSSSSPASSARPRSTCSASSNRGERSSPRHARHRSQGGAPELPPRVLGPSPPASSAQTARAGVLVPMLNTQVPVSTPPPAANVGTRSEAAMSSAASEVTPPNVSVGGVGHAVQQLWEKKDRKEKEVLGLMKRLAGKKKCKSPPPSAYSMDNPVFVDCVSGGQLAPGTTATMVSSHSRSESCPSEAAFEGGTGHKKTASLDVDGDRQNCCNSKSQHAKHPTPLVRERFRCIVPYPPNSDYELELKVGDIIYVHKKREDGWYKGTLQRTGKTGLFPGSFVETY